MVSNARKWMVGSLIIAGVGLYLLLQAKTVNYNPRFWDHKQASIDNESWIERLLLGMALIASVFTPVQRRILTLLDKLRRPSDLTRRWTALALGFCSSISCIGWE